LSAYQRRRAFTVKPEEVELTFGLKATGEAGNIAVAKVGGEATFEIRLLWRPGDGGPPKDALSA
jgi:NTP-dependent ternary system trypsin peptidase co-occuring protein